LKRLTLLYTLLYTKTMPSKNVVKSFCEQSFYHVYNRGVNKCAIFLDDVDYRVFLNLIKRFLGNKASVDNIGRSYKWYGDRVELSAYCLMPNHFHLLLYQYDAQAITELMRSIITSYVMYFNKRYGRIGPLFQQRFKASSILDDQYLQHISRYIHLNPSNYHDWQWSSLKYYTNNYYADWLKPDRIVDLFGSRDVYQDFVADYKDYHDTIELIKHELGY
jgi:putative transposase